VEGGGRSSLYIYLKLNSGLTRPRSASSFMSHVTHLSVPYPLRYSTRHPCACGPLKLLLLLCVVILPEDVALAQPSLSLTGSACGGVDHQLCPVKVIFGVETEA